jgi:hypothetical protein
MAETLDTHNLQSVYGKVLRKDSNLLHGSTPWGIGWWTAKESLKESLIDPALSQSDAPIQLELRQEGDQTIVVQVITLGYLRNIEEE